MPGVVVPGTMWVSSDGWALYPEVVELRTATSVDGIPVYLLSEEDSTTTMLEEDGARMTTSEVDPRETVTIEEEHELRVMYTILCCDVSK